MESTSIFRSTYIKVLTATFLGAATLAVLAYAYFAYIQASHWMTGPMTITVSGEGEVMARPDIGEFTFGVRAEAEAAADAQEQSAAAMNEIVDYLAEAGVDDADISVENYTLNPRYRWEERPCTAEGFCPGRERIVDGYEVSQTISVKVRDLEQSGELISGVGTAWRHQRQQLTVHHRRPRQHRSRSARSRDRRRRSKCSSARSRARRAPRGADQLREAERGGYPEPYMMARSDMGLGGAESAPPMPVGEDEIVSRVYLSYKVK